MKDARTIAREFSQAYATLDDASLEMLAGLIQRREYPRGRTVVSPGEVSDSIYYVERGLIRQFYHKGGCDVTEHLAMEHQKFYCVESVLTGRPSRIGAEALEDSILHLIPHGALLSLTQRSPSIALMYRRFLELDSVLAQHKADELRFGSARERYRNFLRDFPTAALRVQNRHIASLLDISQECLSRLKRDL